MEKRRPPPVNLPTRAGNEEGRQGLGGLLEPSSPKAASSSPSVCACGNHYMTDAVFCRKCGAKREESLVRTDSYWQKLALDKELHPGFRELLAKSLEDEATTPKSPSPRPRRPSLPNVSSPSSPTSPARNQKRSSTATGISRIGVPATAVELPSVLNRRLHRTKTASSDSSEKSHGSLPPLSEPLTPVSPPRSRRGSFSEAQRQGGELLPNPAWLSPTAPAADASPSRFHIRETLKAAFHTETPDGHTPAGSNCNSRRPSRIFDAADGAEMQQAMFNVSQLLQNEIDLNANEVTSRAYSDDDQESNASSFKLNKICRKQMLERPGFGAMPERNAASLKQSLEMAQASMVVTWVLSVTISVFIALQSSGLLLLSKALQHWRLQFLEVAITDWGSRPLAFALLLSYAVLSTLVTSIFVVCVAPRAQGSGIPDVKAFLNGNNIPQLFSFRTWLVRGLGLVLVTSSGLAAGMQGPCGHLGAIASMGISRAIFTSFRTRLGAFGHRSGCEFVAMGAAVGMAAAFSSPVAGILFAMEEASSFWNKGLTWRSFVGCMVAAAVVKTAKTGFRELPLSGFIEFPDPAATFQMSELAPFAVTAIGTSLLGALFCILVQRLAHCRILFYQQWGRRRKRAFQVLEAVLVAAATVATCFWVPLLYGCKQLSKEDHGSSEWYVGMQAQTVCNAGHYSDIGVVLLEHRETAIKALFTHSFEGGAQFDTGRLFAAAGIMFVLTLITYGTALPVGLFIPNMIVGACFGRGIGQLFMSLTDFSVHPGIHALIGAAGMLVGFSRMPVSITMLTLEITNSMRLLLPVMLTILISKALADRLSESVYDISINMNALQEISVVKGELDDEDMPLLRLLTVHDACSVEVQTLRCEEFPARIMSTLTQTKFSGFPLVSTPEHQVLGLVLRTRLVEALQESGDLLVATGGSDSPTRKASDRTINLLMYADTTPEVKHWNTPLAKGHRHFISAGLRHLCIVDETHRLVGIMTRSDLAAVSHPRKRQQAVRYLLQRKEAMAGAQEGTEAIDEEGDYSESDTNSEAPSTATSTASWRGHHLRWNAY